jgi:NADH:ubiquinone oxidoreductase subunit 6 (subunit J)
MPFDYLQFALLVLTLLLAITTIELKNLLYAVLSFCGMCITIGALYWLLNAPYVAVFQILIYAGAVVTIFLAALTLTKMKESIK